MTMCLALDNFRRLWLLKATVFDHGCLICLHLRHVYVLDPWGMDIVIECL
jgi:hypothetical protein